MVATDIAARGIDVDDLTHVINYELPDIAETYVHRIGRTGRAGASGISFSFCEAEETEALRDIHKLIGKQIPLNSNHPYHITFNGIQGRPKQQVRPQRSFGGASRGGNNQGRPKQFGSNEGQKSFSRGR